MTSATGNAKFEAIVQRLPKKLDELLAMTPVGHSRLPKKMPARGVYVFSEGELHLYAGRTNRLRQRLGGHWRPSSTHFSATFAFLLAREATGNNAATYSSKGSRADLLKDDEFAKAFLDAKARLRTMDVRFVEETDPTTQALLEIYVATALATPYNDFDTH